MPKGNMTIGRKSGARAPVVQNRGGAYLSRLDGWNSFFAAAGWNNRNTGRGISGIDKRLDTSFASKGVLPENVIRDLYRGDGMARRIIDLAVEAMTSQGFEIVGDPEGMVVARMEETGIIRAFEELVRWSRLFGGAIGIINVDDGQLWEKPLNFRGIRKVYDVKVYNRWRVHFTTSDLYQDPSNPKFGRPEFYRVQPLMGRSYRVHESRTIRMDGAPVDDLTAWQNQGWGDSYLQPCFDSLASLSSVYDSVENIIDDFVTSTITMKELSELMAQPGGEALVLKRLAIMDKAKAITNTRILSEDETFTKVASSIASLPEMVDRFVVKLAMDAGYPASMLAGEEPGGLNATGDSQTRNFYDKMEANQQKDLRVPVEYVTRLIFLSQDDFFNGAEPENWWVEFNKLWQPTAKEKAEIEKLEVDTGNTLIDRGVMSADEFRDLPEIRARYNLVGPAPEPDPDPLDLFGDDTDGGPKKKGKKDEKVEGEEEDEEEEGENPGKKKAEDSLPADPEKARADMLGACRYLIRDSRGRRRADSAKFEPQTLVVQRAAFATAADAREWVKAHGFKADSMETTRSTFRFAQRDRAEFVPRTEKTLTPTPGVEITMARILG